MAHASFKVIPGVDQNKTPALNEAAISSSQLVRFIPDRTIGGLVQKLGGWTLFYSQPIGSAVRALLAWEDTNSNARLAAGSQGSAVIPITGISGNGTSVTVTFASGQLIPASGTSILISGSNPSIYDGSWTVASNTSTSITFSSSITTTYITGGVIQTGLISSLNVITNNQGANITPQQQIFSLPLTTGSNALFTTASQSLGPNNAINVYIANSNIGANDNIYIKTPISIDGIILSGQYQCTPGSSNNFTIYATSAGGFPVYPITGGVTGGVVATYTVTQSQSYVLVTLPNHGLTVGSTYPVLTPTTVGSSTTGNLYLGPTLLGNYFILASPSAPTTNTFYINASNSATSSASTTPISQNNGNAYIVIYRGLASPQASVGYGQGGYGAGGYGTGVPSVTVAGTQISSSDWTLDNFGENLIACPLNGPIYQWSPTQNYAAAGVIATAPSISEGAFVAMPQRQVIAWATTSNGVKDPLLIRWSDTNNSNSWIASITNQAGSYRLPKGSRIIQGIQGPQQGLIWTDLALWSMQYVGQPYVYQFNEIGTGCGLIGRKAAVSMNGTVFWMGQSQFFHLDANGVQPIMCPIWDVIFQDLDTTNLDKIRAAANSRFGEITWYYPTISGNGEVSAYAKYNVILNQWDFGNLSRTAWINESVLGPPIGATTLYPSGGQYLVQHETSTDDVSSTGSPVAMQSSFQTGYFVLTEANYKIFIDQIWPDMKWGYYGGAQTASIQLTFFAVDYAGQTPTSAQTFGPFTMTQASTFITPRLRGRLVSILVKSSDVGSFWRIGNIRYRYQEDGKY